MEKALSCIALVSCVKQKRNQLSSAKELYTSDWFRKARSYIEQQGVDWYILSANYGLLSPTALIQPYEKTLNKMPVSDRREWASRVLRQISELGCDQTTVFQIYAGQKYREYLLPGLRAAGYSFNTPLARLGIGQQLAWFKSHSTDKLP
ncbi:DUF6884 domain-containing protein [Leptolyngbya sp. FACHB-321]|uniref:DUF6884 domain-containing protein n=1 Tax=Leptolyngbya sp. FACHB-321 TaxID=2692807 RepID=UPI00321FF887